MVAAVLIVGYYRNRTWSKSHLVHTQCDFFMVQVVVPTLILARASSHGSNVCLYKISTYSITRFRKHTRTSYWNTFLFPTASYMCTYTFVYYRNLMVI